MPFIYLPPEFRSPPEFGPAGPIGTIHPGSELAGVEIETTAVSIPTKRGPGRGRPIGVPVEPTELFAHEAVQGEIETEAGRHMVEIATDAVPIDQISSEIARQRLRRVRALRSLFLGLAPLGIRLTGPDEIRPEAPFTGYVMSPATMHYLTHSGMHVHWSPNNDLPHSGGLSVEQAAMLANRGRTFVGLTIALTGASPVDSDRFLKSGGSLRMEHWLAAGTTQFGALATKEKAYYEHQRNLLRHHGMPQDDQLFDQLRRRLWPLERPAQPKADGSKPPTIESRVADAPISIQDAILNAQFTSARNHFLYCSDARDIPLIDADTYRANLMGRAKWGMFGLEGQLGGARNQVIHPMDPKQRLFDWRYVMNDLIDNYFQDAAKEQGTWADLRYNVDATLEYGTPTQRVLRTLSIIHNQFQTLRVGDSDYDFGQFLLGRHPLSVLEANTFQASIALNAHLGFDHVDHERRKDNLQSIIDKTMDLLSTRDPSNVQPTLFGTRPSHNTARIDGHGI